MSEIPFKKETTVQSYGQFWSAFLHLKGLIDKNQPGWLKIKLAALTMACFTIEGFCNHVGQKLFSSWDSIERGMSPIGKLKLFIETKNIEIKYGENPFNTVSELMKWRNKVAHGKTEVFTTLQIASPETYDQLLGQIEKSDWEKYIINANLDIIEEACKSLMETVHEKSLGNLDWFLVSFWQVRGSVL